MGLNFEFSVGNELDVADVFSQVASSKYREFAVVFYCSLSALPQYSCITTTALAQCYFSTKAVLI